MVAAIVSFVARSLNAYVPQWTAWVPKSARAYVVAGVTGLGAWWGFYSMMPTPDVWVAAWQALQTGAATLLGTGVPRLDESKEV